MIGEHCRGSCSSSSNNNNDDDNFGNSEEETGASIEETSYENFYQEMEKWLKSNETIEGTEDLDEFNSLDIQLVLQPSMTTEVILDVETSGKVSPCLNLKDDVIEVCDAQENTDNIRSLQQVKHSNVSYPLSRELQPEKKSILSALNDAKRQSKASSCPVAASALNIIVGGNVIVTPAVYIGYPHNYYQQPGINASSNFMPNLVNNTEAKIEVKTKETCKSFNDKQSEAKKRKEPERILYQTPQFRKKKKVYDQYTQSFSFLKPE